MLQVQNFSFFFGATPVLQDLTFCLPQGGYLSVIGPNGAGKSTLLKCLMGLHERGSPQGQAMVKGRPLQKYAQRELAQVIAYVPQAGGWVPPFTVEEFLGLSRYPYAQAWSGLRDVDFEHIENALQLTGSTELRKRSLRALSGGERQRIFLAAALAQDAEVMLLDEPDSFLDPRHAFELKELMRKLNQEEGVTMVTVTHDLNHPFALGGQVLALQQGRQVFCGTGQELLAQGVLEHVFGHRFLRLQHPGSNQPIVLAE